MVTKCLMNWTFDTLFMNVSIHWKKNYNTKSTHSRFLCERNITWAQMKYSRRSKSFIVILFTDFLPALLKLKKERKKRTT